MSKKVLVIGLQRSGHAAIKLLKKQGYEIIVTINNELTKEDKEILGDIVVYENGHPESLLEENWEFIVKNPGVPYYIPFVKKALEKNIKIISEIELAYMYSDNINLALTGTNGKTTTTTLIYDIFKKAFDNVYCAGNIGLPLSDVVLEHNKGNIVILELSSFQLMGIDSFRPKIASIINLAPDHLDYMPSVESYYKSKLDIYKNQDNSDYYILNEDDKLVNEYVKDVKAQIIGYSLEKKSDAYLKDDWLYFKDEAIIDTNKVQIIGKHNLYNILVAICYAKLMDVSTKVIQDVVYDFKGVEFRLERVVGMKNNIYYNDSKSTTPDSTITAINALKGHETVLIIGGFNKGLNFSEMNALIDSLDNIELVLAFGEIKTEFSSLQKKVIEFENLIEVVDYIEENVDNKNILFSPATSSFDQYDNYEQRGRHFNKLIKR
ncbi:UDP-N-acetylmuramoylalanine--D-glutamate ligase [Bacilli bacterium PM5-9]|nr:UDP-N-acetylmuramoylalanine--D-glutamate ligase [Bacilli bacterium PM5-9]